MSEHRYAFETGVASDRGKVRDVNEDNWFADESRGVWLVADGMGGHTNGKLASATIVESARTLGQAVSAPDLRAQFADRMYRANEELQQYSAAHGNEVLGSTLVSILVFGGHFACVWAGDSRSYLVRGREIHQVSRDHTEVQNLLDRGVIDASQARTWRRNVITRAVGVFNELELDLVEGQIFDGDRFVLCSDGLTGHVSDQEIYEIVSEHGSQDACDRLVDMTLARGATDNVTVVVTRCRALETGGAQFTATVEDVGGG